MTVEPEQLLNAKDVQKIFRCSLPTVYKLAEQGRLACVRIPSLGNGKPRAILRFKKGDVIAFIERHYRGT